MGFCCPRVVGVDAVYRRSSNGSALMDCNRKNSFWQARAPATSACHHPSPPARKATHFPPSTLHPVCLASRQPRIPSTPHSIDFSTSVTHRFSILLHTADQKSSFLPRQLRIASVLNTSVNNRSSARSKVPSRGVDGLENHSARDLFPIC